MQTDTQTLNQKPSRVLLERWGVVVWLDGATLMGCAQGDPPECEFELSAPESQEFLDSVNGSLGTTFKLEEFPGR